MRFYISERSQSVKMLKLIFLIQVALLGIIESNRITRGVYPPVFPDHWMEQKLDHIYNSTNKTWRMKYLFNDEYCEDEENGPIFIRLGGANSISSQPLQYGCFHDLAKKHKALLYNVEHRFYGESIPNDDLGIDNLRYLTLGQVLADIEHFIVQITNETESRKVILFGESYAGSLVVWMKSQYPKLVTGGWASSAPLLAKLDFPEYEIQIGKILSDVGGERCFSELKNGIAKLINFTDVNELQLCPVFDSSNNDDMMALSWNIAKTISTKLQEGFVSSVCRAISPPPAGGDLGKLTNWILKNSQLFENGCYNVSYENAISSISDVNNFSGDRQFFYQQCNEFGWFKTTTDSKQREKRRQPFGNKLSLAFFVKLCSTAFGKHFTKRAMQFKVEITNNKFGGLSPNVEDIFMTHGEYDPWSIVGMSDQVKIISGAFHCDDVYSVSPRDSDSMTGIKRDLAEFMNKLLS